MNKKQLIAFQIPILLNQGESRKDSLSTDTLESKNGCGGIQYINAYIWNLERWYYDPICETAKETQI